MQRVPQTAGDTREGHLVITGNGTRMRVVSVDPVHDGQDVILHGYSASGFKGVAMNHDQQLIRLD